MEATGELAGGCARGGKEGCVGDFVVDEKIDRMLIGGDFGGFERAVGPELFGFVTTVLPGVVKCFGGGDFFSFGILLADEIGPFFIGPGGSGIDPVSDVPLLFFGELIGFLGRHLVVLDGARGEAIEVAFRGVAGDEDFVGEFVSAFEGGFAGAHVESAFLFVLAVTDGAALGKEWLDVESEEFFSSGGFDSGKGGGREETDEEGMDSGSHATKLLREGRGKTFCPK